MTPQHHNHDSTEIPCNLPVINPETTTIVSVPPVSPTPSSHSRHVSFLSWISGRGSTSGQNSSKNYSANFCRICHEGESTGEKLISPCRCSGSVGLMHRSCVEKWLSSTNHDTCEICKQKYSISRHPRPFSSWLCEPVVGDDQRNLVGDGICFLLLTPLAAISAYLCFSGAIFYLEEKQSEAIGLICLSTLLVIIYMAWLLLTIRYHCQVWFKWRSHNQDIKLLDVSGQRTPLSPVGRQPEQHQIVIIAEVFEDVEIVVNSEKEMSLTNPKSNITSLSSHQGDYEIKHLLGDNTSSLSGFDLATHQSDDLKMADATTPVTDQWQQLASPIRTTTVLDITSSSVKEVIEENDTEESASAQSEPNSHLDREYFRDHLLSVITR